MAENYLCVKNFGHEPSTIKHELIKKIINRLQLIAWKDSLDNVKVAARPNTKQNDKKLH